jgi:DNA-binding NtrC family response regulator
MPLDALHRRLRAAMSAERVGARTIRIRPPRGAVDEWIDAMATRLSGDGFVVVRPGRAQAGDGDSTIVRQHAHRHVALVVADAADRLALGTWMATLSRASPRAHLVIDVRTSRTLEFSCRRPSLVRERAPTTRSLGESVARSRSWRRVWASLRRGRFASAEQWARSALEEARRRGTAAGVGDVVARFSAALAARGQWPAAARVALDARERLRHWEDVVSATVAAAHALGMAGELRRAAAVLAGVEAEAAARGAPQPDGLHLALAQVAFWQGRFEHAATHIARVDAEDDDARLWRALIAWACGDESRMQDARACAERLIASTADAPCVHGLAIACAFECGASLSDEDEQDGRVGRQPVDRDGRMAPLHAALIEWQYARADHGKDASRKCEGFIERSGAAGLRRWGLRRSEMHLMHAMPALVRVTQDAEDELAVLTGGCRWLQQHLEGGMVAVLTADGTRRLAGAGPDGADADLAHPALRAVVCDRGRTVSQDGQVWSSAPVRWAGSTIGLVVTRGPADLAATMQESAAAWAALCAPALRARLDALAVLEAGGSVAPEIIGQSAVIGAVRDAIARAAMTKFPVLIEGESGTGKELAARALHRLSSRRDRPFCAINCAALSDDLIEAELFGYTRGAFTGAVASRAGLFEEAHGGTLFLDEVGELSPRAQAKLLRTLQEREIRRVGENVSRPIDVRIVAATNRPLAEAVGDATFRADLLFRLAVVRCQLPPLRDRLEDIPLLVHAFWRRLSADAGRHAVVGPDAMAALCRHAWPGNVRELQNAIASILVIAPTRGRVTARHVSQVLGTPPVFDRPAPLDAQRRTFERHVVASALARHGGARSAAARDLGLSRQGLIKALKRLGLSDPAPPRQTAAVASRPA